MTKTNNTNPATNNTPAINFRAPIRTEIPVTINFNAPINLTYNGAAEEKVTASDLQRYICEQTTGQCETVPAGRPAPIKPAPKCTAPTDKSATKSCSAPTSINIPIRDRADDTAYRYDAKKGTGVAEATINDLAESLGN